MVSVIIPVYNGGIYLEPCITSIIQQSYTDLEIILIDDGSKDNSLQICRDYAKREKRIQVIANGTTLGTAKTRNIGINASHGEYIAFVDDDDIIHQNFFELLYKKEQQSGADIIQCTFQWFSQEQDINRDVTIKAEHHFDGISAVKELCSTGDVNVQYCVVFNKLFRRELFDTVRFEDGKVHEDVFIMHKLFLKAQKIVFLEIQLYFYRKNPDSITKITYHKKRLDNLEAMEQRAFYVKEKDRDIYIMALIQLLHAQINNYYNMKKFFPEDKLNIYLIRSNFKRYYAIVKRHKNLMVCNEPIKFKLFLYIPHIYYAVVYRHELDYFTIQKKHHK